MMKKIYGKIISLGLALTLTVSCFSCGKKNSESSSGSSGGIAQTVVWTATANEKFVREVDYSSRYDSKTLEIKAFRNEEEAGQIMISAAEDTTYTLELGELKSASGEVFKQFEEVVGDDGETTRVDYITVYNEKYINVATPKDTLNAQGAGHYADALLPYAKAVEYKENKVSKGENQGIYVSVKPSKTQAAGTYTGNFKLTLNGKERLVPVSITVYDYTLSDQTHMKTLISYPTRDVGVAELDTSAEMAYEYAEFMASKKILSSVPVTAEWGFDRDAYFDFVAEKIDDPRVSVIRAPFTGGATAVKTITIDGFKTLAIDENINSPDCEVESIATVLWDGCQPLYEQYFKESFKRGKNMYDKMIFYLSIIDEFDSSSNVAFGLLKATYNLRRMEDMFIHIGELVDSLEWSEDGVLCRYEIKFDTETYGVGGNGGYGYYLSELDEPYYLEDNVITEDEFESFKARLVESIGEVTSVTTATQIYDFIYENQSFASFCPTIEHIIPVINEHEAYADKADREMWTYTAVNPQAPYPTYHMEDALISARMLGTIMYENNIAGNLFWATLLSRVTDGNDAQLSGQDYYDDALRFTGANGDGFLMYPGRPYGIYGPVSSMRLESIRDSVDDYDLLYELENYFYVPHGASCDDFDSILAFATDGMYSGARVNYDEGYIERFATARDFIASLLALASNTDTVVNKYEFVNGKACFTVTAPEGVEIYANGRKCSGTVDGDYVKYEIEIALDKADNYFNLKSVKNGKAYETTFTLGGRVDSVDLSTLKGTASVIKDSATFAVDSEGLKVSFSANAERTSARIKFAVSSLNWTGEYDSITVKINNVTGKRLTLKVTGKATKETAMAQSIGELESGWNEISLKISSFGVSGDDVLEYLIFQMSPIGGDSLVDVFDVYIKDVTLKRA